VPCSSRRESRPSSLVLFFHLSGLPESSLPDAQPEADAGPFIRLLASLRVPSAFPALCAPFSPSHLTSAWLTCPCVPEVPSSGFGYPLDGVSCTKPWKSFSSPDARGILSSERFSGLGIELGFHSILPLLRFLIKPLWLDAGASAVFSPKTSRTLAPRRCYNLGKAACSLELHASRVHAC
jgi:hypothetical protein